MQPQTLAGQLDAGAEGVQRVSHQGAEHDESQLIRLIYPRVSGSCSTAAFRNEVELYCVALCNCITFGVPPFDMIEGAKG